MAKKQKCNCPPPGAPNWVMTYGDMMSLLLTFFIILVSISEIRDVDKYQAIVVQIQQAFGMLGGSGRASLEDIPATSLIRRLEEVHTRNQRKVTRFPTGALDLV